METETSFDQSNSHHHPLALREPAYEVPPTAAAAVRRIRAGLGSVAPVIPGTGGELAPKQERVDILRKIYDRDTFATMMNWLTSGKIDSDQTKRAYADDMRHWATAVYNLTGAPVIRLADIDRRAIRTTVLAWEDDGHSNRTINRRLAALQSLHAYDCYERDAELTQLVSPHDRRKVTTAAKDAAGTRALTMDQLNALLAHNRNDSELALISLIYATAGRITEVCEADLGDLEADGDGSYTLRLDRKGGKTDEPFPIAGALLDILMPVIGERLGSRGPLIVNAKGERYTRNQAASILTRMGREARVWTCDRAGSRKRGADGTQHSFRTCQQCKALTPHVLRATKLTHMYVIEQVPVETIRVFASHADVSTTLGYIRRADNRRIKAEALEASNRVFAALGKALTLSGKDAVKRKR